MWKELTYVYRLLELSGRHRKAVESHVLAYAVDPLALGTDAAADHVALLFFAGGERPHDLTKKRRSIYIAENDIEPIKDKATYLALHVHDADRV